MNKKFSDIVKNNEAKKECTQPSAVGHYKDTNTTTIKPKDKEDKKK